jgi:hypothetical protein
MLHFSEKNKNVLFKDIRLSVNKKVGISAIY